MTHSNNDTNRQEKLPTAPLPQKNAVAAANGQTAQHAERLLDDALESTFPASDPVAEPHAETRCTPEEAAALRAEEEAVEHEEFLLDEALEMTFPASDPIAIPDPETMAKTASQHGR